jgi:hypothetical protein
MKKEYYQGGTLVIKKLIGLLTLMELLHRINAQEQPRRHLMSRDANLAKV